MGALMCMLGGAEGGGARGRMWFGGVGEGEGGGRTRLGWPVDGWVCVLVWMGGGRAWTET